MFGSIHVWRQTSDEQIANPSVISSNKQTNELDVTIKISEDDLFSFFFWKKMKTPIRHFEINWRLNRLM